MSERRLYRKGDKITITFEVIEDQRRYEAVWVRVGEHYQRYLVSEILDQGKLEPAPEPPYVPKIGDEFHFWPDAKADGYPPCKCIWIDNKSIVFERVERRGSRGIASLSTAYDFVRA